MHCALLLTTLLIAVASQASAKKILAVSKQDSCDVMGLSDSDSVCLQRCQQDIATTC
jgi:hypothetical protein